MAIRHLVLSFPAEIQMIMKVDTESGDVSVAESILWPDQVEEIDATRHIETINDGMGLPRDADDTAAANMAVEWASENGWPVPTRMTADGVSPSPCFVCGGIVGLDGRQCYSAAHPYPRGVWVCSETCSATHYKELAEECVTDGDA